MTVDGHPEYQPRSFDDVEHLDRRSSPRFSSHLHGNETVEIWVNARASTSAVIIDESLDGLGVSCADHPSFQQGRILDVIYRGKRKQAEIRYKVKPSNVADVKMGLHWC